MAFILTRAIIWYEYKLFTLNDDIYGKARTRALNPVTCCHLLWS